MTMTNCGNQFSPPKKAPAGATGRLLQMKQPYLIVVPLGESLARYIALAFLAYRILLAPERQRLALLVIQLQLNALGAVFDKNEIFGLQIHLISFHILIITCVFLHKTSCGWPRNVIKSAIEFDIKKEHYA